MQLDHNSLLRSLVIYIPKMFARVFTLLAILGAVTSFTFSGSRFAAKVSIACTGSKQVHCNKQVELVHFLTFHLPNHSRVSRWPTLLRPPSVPEPSRPSSVIKSPELLHSMIKLANFNLETTNSSRLPLLQLMPAASTQQHQHLNLSE